ncbi:uncharacterized protein I206_103895 [Kwoniella pini CBS 10737]|uniref:Uncharacterized protein n=1 Tax=Kwoniella pini CBS 10737 TaxID=1296096 RepID=A0A1B9I3G4_9TREE|nr:uncharacterized protein I206_04532 [Kwoniella pini CBS 10737]OCF50001.1 hypothetical protein I206_04532 [Kwoniella pini CBS 10737]
MTISQRSSNKVFHQWSSSHERSSPSNAEPLMPITPRHHNVSHTSHKNRFGDVKGYYHPESNLKSDNRAIKVPGLNDLHPTNTPGSPSQIDPFGSQVNLPSPIPPHHSLKPSRPPSTVLSSDGSPLPESNNQAVTPRITVASPSTSTIHYLFPSSDTRTGIHLTNNSTTTASTAIVVEATSNGGTSDVKLKRGYSLTRGNSLKIKTRTHSPTESNLNHRDIPGLTNKRSLPTPNLKQQEVLTGSNKTAQMNRGGLKRSDISNPYPSLSDEARDYSKGYYDVGPEQDTMGTLRRQPGMEDLSGKSRLGITERSELKENLGGIRRRESIILKEIENRRDKRGWEIGHNKAIEQKEMSSMYSKPKTSVSKDQDRKQREKPNIPPITIIQQRRRSQSLSSPRPAPCPPIDPARSPLIPAPDLGDPLSLSVVMPSPSYSHLDYSPAGSSACSTNSLSRSISKRGIAWGKRASVIFPVPSSIRMSRGDTRKDLGDYDSAKLKVKQDYENRTAAHGVSNGKLGRIASIKRTVSLRKKDQQDSQPIRRARPRSQSLTENRILKSLDEAPPLPSPSMMKRGYVPYGQEYASSAYTGELSLDFGDRYYQDNKSTTTLEMELTSPRSVNTSYFPGSTPTSSDFNHIKGRNAIRIVGKPLHPALNNRSDDSLSISAPSTVGLGFSPVGTPVSLPGSLLEEMIDLTDTGLGDRRVSSPMIESVITPPTPQNQGTLPAPGLLLTHIGFDDSSEDIAASTPGSQSQRIPRRSVLLAQNRFYIPPPANSSKLSKPKQEPDLGERPFLRSSKSMGQGLMKRAYTSGNLKVDANKQSSCQSTEEGKPHGSSGLLKSASIRSSTQSFSKLSDDQHKNGKERQYGTERISSTHSMKFKSRPLTTFSICSPPDAIDPLPYTSPYCAEGRNTPSTSQRRKSLRSNKSSPFLSASNSLRVIFGKEGFVARCLSQAFEKDQSNDRNQSPQHTNPNKRERSFSPEMTKEELKMKISSPLEASTVSSRRNESPVYHQESSKRALSPQYEQAREIGRNADKKWRESVLQEALTLSISNSSLNRLANESELENIDMPRMVSSGSKNRLAIPGQLLSAPTITINNNNERDTDPIHHDTSDGYAGIGQSMLQSQNSLESSLNLRAIMEVENWDLIPPTRTLGVVGKEESLVSAPSMYSNNASTLYEKPSSSSKRLVGKGFPTSFSIADLTKRNTSKSKNIYPTKQQDGDLENTLNANNISQPIPILTPMNYNSSLTKTFDLQPSYMIKTDQTDTHEETRNAGSIWNNKSSFLKNRSSSRSNTPDPANISRSVSPIQSQSTQTQTPDGSSAWKLSLKSSIKQKRSGISSNDLLQDKTQPIHPKQTENGVLNELLTRDQIHPQSNNNEVVDGNIRETNKLNKVLAWRNEVDENENLAQLDQKIRGFVSDERERVRGIGRKSIEG